MKMNNTEFDARLRELEAESMAPTDQVDNHWKKFKELLQEPVTPITRPMTRNPTTYWSFLVIGIMASYILYKSLYTPEVDSKSIPSKDTTTVSKKSYEVKQDTIPLQNSARTNSRNPVKSTSAKKSAKNTDKAAVSLSATHTTKQPIKRVYGVRQKEIPLQSSDSIQLVPIKNEKSKTGDTIYFQPLKQKARASHVTFRREPTKLAGDLVIVTQKAPTLKSDTLHLTPQKSSTLKGRMVIDPLKKDSAIIIIEDSSQFNNLEELLQVPYFLNKVVYIDLWGTRCPPCLEEFRNLPSLKEKYKGQDLVFLYLKSPYGFDDSKEWKQLIHQYQLTGMNVSMSIRFYSDRFWNKYAIHYADERLFGIPTYLIVNKQGKIIDYDAPRPGDKVKLYSLLDKQLQL